MLGSIGEKESYQEASQRVTEELTAIVDAFHAWMSGNETTQSEATTTSSIPMSSLVRRLFTSFPLRTFAPAPVLSPRPHERIKKPILYVAKPHPGMKQNWASQDPRCLYWQMLLLFRDVDYDCVHVGDYDDPNNAIGQLPFLQNVNTTIVAAKDLPLWVQRVAPAEERIEKNDVIEEKGVESLLKGPLMAGVVSVASKIKTVKGPFSLLTTSLFLCETALANSQLAHSCYKHLQANSFSITTRQSGL